MTTPHNFAINKRWGHIDNKTSTLHLHPKQLMPTEMFLCDLLTTDILMDIDIWVTNLKHRNKFKAFIKNINTMCNPTLFAITPELWSPYHNFSVYSCWCNELNYKWEYRRILTNTCSRYQLLGSYSTGIRNLTQRHIDFHESVVA